MSEQHGGRLRTDRRYPLAEPRDRAWDALAQVDRYRDWWPWLRELDAPALAPGERWRARIRVPMPWSLRFVLDIEAVEAPGCVVARISGDIEGTATVTLEDHGARSAIRLRSDLAPRHRLLAAVNRTVPALSRRLHDRVVDKAFRQFAARPEGAAHGRSG